VWRRVGRDWRDEVGKMVEAGPQGGPGWGEGGEQRRCGGETGKGWKGEEFMGGDGGREDFLCLRNVYGLL
jgi:hypothetical protein